MNRVGKPRWGWLYVVLTLLMGLLGLVEVSVPAAALRRVLEFFVSILIFAVMALWVRLNRVELTLLGEREGSPRRLVAPTPVVDSSGPVNRENGSRSGSSGSPARACSSPMAAAARSRG